MQDLIQQVRDTVPFAISPEELCSGLCHGCSKKLLEFLDMELEDWEHRLEAGEQPRLGDVQRLAKRSRKIYAVLQRNGVTAA
jgi:hypothetical protein